MSELKDWYEVSYDGGKTWRPISFRALGDHIGSSDIKDLWNGETVEVRGAKYRCIIEKTDDPREYML